MTINYVNEVESKIPNPMSTTDFESWLKQIELYEEFERVKRVAASKPTPEKTMINFLNTNCPELIGTYNYFYKNYKN